MGPVFPHTLGAPIVKTHLKNAVMTTAIVLASIYVLRRITVTKNLVDTALAG